MSPERVVIAKLEVDEKGVVRSYKSAGDAAGKMGSKTSAAGKKMATQMNQSSNIVSKNLGQMAKSMFALSTAATALFSIGVVVRQVKIFVFEMLKTAESMDRAAAAAGLLKDEFSLLFVRLFDIDNIVSSITDKMILLVALFEESNALMERMKVSGGGLSQVFNNMTFGLSGAVQTIGGVGVKLAEAGLADRIALIRAEVDRLAFAAKELNEALTFDPFVKVLAAPEVIQTAGLGPASRDLFDMLGAVEFRDVMAENASIFEESIGRIEESLKTAADHFQMFQTAAATAGSILGQAFASGATNIRGLISQTLGFVAVLASSRFATYMAAATGAAAGGVGMIIEGADPGRLLAAAAMWKKVAIGSAAGAAFLGASGGGGATGAGSVNQFGQEPNIPPARAQSVTVVIEGSVIGVGKTRDQFARELAGDIATAWEDGAPRGPKRTTGGGGYNKQMHDKAHGW